MQWGFRAVISTSFADIFLNNSLKNGLLPIAVPPEELMRIGSILEAEPDAQLAIDLETSELRLPDGSIIPFTIDSFARRMILDGTDELGYLLAREPELQAYEARTRRGSRPWHEPAGLHGGDNASHSKAKRT